MNDAGECMTNAELIESTTSSMMSAEEMEETKKRVEKRSGRRVLQRRLSRSQNASDRKSIKYFEEKTVKSDNSDIIIDETSVTTKFTTTVERGTSDKTSIETSIKVITREDTIIEEVQGSTVKEIQHDTKQFTYDSSNIQTLKTSEDVEKLLKNMQSKGLNTNNESLRDLAAIAQLSQQGMSVADISQLYQANSFPALLNPEAQSALVQLLEREGHAKLVSEVLTDATDTDEDFVANAGFRAFMKMVELKKAKIEDMISLLVPEDFVSHEWKNTSEV